MSESPATVAGSQQDSAYRRMTGEDEMKTEKFTGTMKSAFGVKLTKLKMKDGSPCTIKKLNYDGDYKQYETKEEMIQAEGMPKDEDIVDWRNTLIKNAARA